MLDSATSAYKYYRHTHIYIYSGKFQVALLRQTCGWDKDIQIIKGNSVRTTTYVTFYASAFIYNCLTSISKTLKLCEQRKEVVKESILHTRLHQHMHTHIQTVKNTMKYTQIYVSSPSATRYCLPYALINSLEIPLKEHMRTRNGCLPRNDNINKYVYAMQLG